MNTYLSEVFSFFLSSISDYDFANLSEEEIKEDLLDLFKKARTKFYKCKNSLEISQDPMGEYQFTTTLTPFEISIISNLMLVEYLKPVMLSSEKLKQSLSDRDFKIHSQASQLREVTLLYHKLKRDTRKQITEYTYIGMSANDYKQ